MEALFVSPVRLVSNRILPFNLMLSSLRSGSILITRWLAAGCCWLALQAGSATIPGLFPTGVNNSGALLGGGSVDPHYRLIQSADGGFPGPNAWVVNDGYPIAPAANGVWLANGPTSKWIAPQAPQGTGNAAGDYVFRLSFDLTGLEPASAIITGRWTSDNAGLDVRLNGASTGITYDGNFGTFSEMFTINRGFREGTNTLDFVVNNAGTAGSPIGLRVELSGTADPEAPPGTAPSILESPASATVGQGDAAVFQVRAYGSKPMSYQWRHQGEPIANATNATLNLLTVSAADAGSYDVGVVNAFGSATSDAATLSVVYLSPAELSYEPAGPSSRRTGLSITEIMFHPVERPDGRNVEFVELYNSNPFFEDLSGYRLTGEYDYTFPPGTRIEGLGYLVVAPAPADVQAVYGLTGVLGGFTNRLANSGGTVRLRKKSGGIVLEVTYNDQPPWPAAADGTGHSLVLVRPSYGERDPHAWAASARRGGSPGGPDPVPTGPLEGIVINEILAHTDLPLVDYIELYNHSPVAVDISGCWITDDPQTNKFQIPAGTTLDPRGFAAFTETQLGFGLSANGETVYLVSPDQQRVLDALRFGGQANGVAYGRFPDGAASVQELTAGTPGTTNAPMLIRDIVINEIMYHPLSEDADDEYVELYNRGTAAVDLGGWRFSDGIDFAIPAPALLPAGGYLVVARNAARLLTNYPGLNPSAVVGNYGGTLADGGEHLVLARPESLIETNGPGGRLTTNTYFVVVDEVTYGDGGQWGRWSDGGGSSLELKDPRADNRLASNWGDSDETHKAPWTLVETTGVLDLGTGNASTNLQIHLQGPGQALVDDVEVSVSNGANRIPNPGFEADAAGWVFKGTHRLTSWESSEGYNSAHALHLRASDRGDTVNFVRASFTQPLTAGQTNLTIRARARWLCGHPEVLFRLKENYLEAEGRLAVPRNLGTPGAPNSIAVPDAPPAIYQVSHRPALPAANQPIRVTAQVDDPDGVASVVLRYRIDPGSTRVTVPMVDNGAGGDLVAGDGVYVGIIPGQPPGTLVAFAVEATDAAGLPASRRFPDDPERECLVRSGESVVPGRFGNYRMWMTQATFNFWSSREKMSNEALDVTFVYGTHRIVYNAGACFAGSAWTSPGYTTPSGGLCGYDIFYPDDNAFLGETHVILDWPVRDVTNQREQMMFWLLDQYGLPNLYRRYVHLFVNGVRRGTIYDDVQQPGNDVISEWFPDDDEGDLLKTNFYFEYADNQNREGGTPNTLEIFTTTGGVKKTARYRWNWKPRAVRGSANDFQSLFALVDAMNSVGAAYIPSVESLVDVEHWMRTFAMNDLASYWDAFGNPNYKNTYLYKPQHAGWKLFCWDFDVGLGAGINIDNERVTAPLFPSGIDPVMQRLYQTPAFVRLYWQALDEAVNSFFTADAMTPLLTAKYQAFVDNGVNLTSPFVASGPFGYTIPSFVTQRRAYLTGQLATVTAPFAVSGPASLTVSNNLLVLSGTAPVSLHTLTVNGTPFPVTWTTVTNWTLRLVVPGGSNGLTLAALDRFDQPLPGLTREVAVSNTAEDLAPEGVVVISEIMYHPLQPGAAFIELQNTSPTHAFDLSGWRLNGLDYTFPTGSILEAGAFLVLVEDPVAFRAAFGNNVPFFDQFAGRFDVDGETLSLLRPGPVAGEEMEVDRVTYDPLAPWPTRAGGQGPSLQVIDPLRDNSRVSNWSDGQGWRFFSTNASVGSSVSSPRLSFFLDTGGGDVFLDDIQFYIDGPGGVGTNLVRNAGFEEGWTQWGVGTLASNSVLVTNEAHSGSTCVHLIIKPGATTLTNLYQNLGAVVPNTNHTLSFWYKTGSAGTNLSVYFKSVYRHSVSLQKILATPGAPSTDTAILPPYPPLWLSEVQPDNRSTLIDNHDEFDPWIEIYNAGAAPLSLQDIFLSNAADALQAWAFPADAVLLPGEFRIVWADAQPDQTDPLQWHASFRLNPTNGSVYLTRTVNALPEILDVLHYGPVASDLSYGAWPPGQNSWRQTFAHPTPGQTNNPAATPLPLLLNEWMASNTGIVRDPADQDPDDWFELFNPNDAAVNLAGYQLSDDPFNPSKFVVPAGFQVAPHAFFRVWADEERTQTRTPDQLHVNFRLSGTGESLVLSAPDGQLLDAVTFGPQTANVSEGRWPDGQPAPFFGMPVPTPGAPNQVPTPAEPHVQSITVNLAAGTATLLWDAEPNARYRVQYKLHLSEATWTDLEGDVQAVGLTATKTDSTLPVGQPGAQQRFYHVLRLLP